MSSSSRLIAYFRRTGLFLIPLMGLVFLSACGFEPLHGSGNTVDSSLASTRIEVIPDRNGQILHNQLRDKLNPKGLAPNPLYSLTVDLSVTTRTTGFTSEQDATYATIIASAQYKLTRRSDSQEVYSGTSEAVTSYNQFVTPYTNRYSENDATERALVSLSQDLYTSLSTFFSTTN